MGDAGVGKTATAEGLARIISAEKVLHALRADNQLHAALSEHGHVIDSGRVRAMLTASNHK